MKAISIIIQIVLSILGLATIGAFLAARGIYSSGVLLFGLGMTAILWWVAINLYKQIAPSTYLPKVAIYTGAFLSSNSAFYLLAAYAGQATNLSSVQILAGLIGGFLIMKNIIRPLTRSSKQGRSNGHPCLRVVIDG